MDDLTKKQKGFVKDYVKTGNGVQSVLKNYDTEDYSTAGNIASENLNKPKIQNAILSIAEQIPDELLIKVHLEGLNAYDEVKDNEGNILIKPDYSVRHKYLDTAHKIKGNYAPERSINLDIHAEVTNPRAMELAQEFEDKLKQTL